MQAQSPASPARRPTAFSPHGEAGSPPVGGPNFFVSQKRGEVGELRNLLRSLPAEDVNQPQNRQRRREVLKRLIAYMTLGIDVSPLFPEVVLTSATNDVVQKKLISLFLNNYAEWNQELLVLAVNAYQKDLKDVDPRIRGLALKALTSLRAESVAEYAEDATWQSLVDPSGYVRRAAIMGVLKLIATQTGGETSKAQIRAKFYERVQENLYATDPQVAVTALTALNEIDGGTKVTRKLVVHLFNKLEKCDTFDRIMLLSLLAQYIPRNTDEMLALIESLERQLLITSPGVVMGTITVMLSFVRLHVSRESETAAQQQGGALLLTAWMSHPLAISVVARSKSSLMTLLTSASPEGNFAVLSYINQLVGLSPAFSELLAEDWETLLPRYTDKPYNSILRMSTLSLIANQDNWHHIMEAILIFMTPPTCLKPCVLKMALSLLGCIALKFPTEVCQVVVSELAFLFRMEIPELQSAILPVTATVLWKHSKIAGDILPFISTRRSLIEDLDYPALQALVWLSGEFPEHCCPQSYLLFDDLIDRAFPKTLLETSDAEIDPGGGSAGRRLADDVVTEERMTILKDILAACCKILFVDPAGVRPVFLKALAVISANIADASPDLIERFLTTVRLLKRKPQVLLRVYGVEAIRRQKMERENEEICFLGQTTATFQQLDSINALLTRPFSLHSTLPFGGTYDGDSTCCRPTLGSEELKPEKSQDIEVPTVASFNEPEQRVKHEDLLLDSEDETPPPAGGSSTESLMDLGSTVFVGSPCV